MKNTCFTVCFYYYFSQLHQTNDIDAEMQTLGGTTLENKSLYYVFLPQYLEMPTTAQVALCLTHAPSKRQVVKDKQAACGRTET